MAKYSTQRARYLQAKRMGGIRIGESQLFRLREDETVQQARHRIRAQLGTWRPTMHRAGRRAPCGLRSVRRIADWGAIRSATPSLASKIVKLRDE
jgi:hypothetical protein